MNKPKAIRSGISNANATEFTFYFYFLKEQSNAMNSDDDLFIIFFQILGSCSLGKNSWLFIFLYVQIDRLDHRPQIVSSSQKWCTKDNQDDSIPQSTPTKDHAKDNKSNDQSKRSTNQLDHAKNQPWHHHQVLVIVNSRQQESTDDHIDDIADDVANKEVMLDIAKTAYSGQDGRSRSQDTQDGNDDDSSTGRGTATTCFESRHDFDLRFFRFFADFFSKLDLTKMLCK
jgi:hypothetical protein